MTLIVPIFPFSQHPSNHPSDEAAWVLTGLIVTLNNTACWWDSTDVKLNRIQHAVLIVTDLVMGFSEQSPDLNPTCIIEVNSVTNHHYNVQKHLQQLRHFVWIHTKFRILIILIWILIPIIPILILIIQLLLIILILKHTNTNNNNINTNNTKTITNNTNYYY